MSGRAGRVRQAFRLQAAACEELGSPFTARLCRLFAERLTADDAVGDLILDWPGDPSHAGDSIPLRLCGALNFLVLDGRAAELIPFYPPAATHRDLSDDAVWAALETAMGRHGEAVIAFLASAPQTNEVRRSVFVIPAWHALAARFSLPLAVREIGASAGLNLNGAVYGLEAGSIRLGPDNASLLLTPQWRGEAPVACQPAIASARGCDLAPIDPGNEEHRLRLMAYVWPDQVDRVSLIASAVAIAHEAGIQPERADAIDWLARELESRREGEVFVIQHTIAWQYFPRETQQRGEQLLAEHGAAASPDAPIARLSMEADGEEPGAGLRMTVWPEGQVHALGRADFHGRWIDWRNPRW